MYARQASGFRAANRRLARLGKPGKGRVNGVFRGRGAGKQRCDAMVRRRGPGGQRSITCVNKRKTTTSPGLQVIEGSHAAIRTGASVNSSAVHKYNISLFDGLSRVALNGERSTTISKLQDLNDVRETIGLCFALRLHRFFPVASDPSTYIKAVSFQVVDVQLMNVPFQSKPFLHAIFVTTLWGGHWRSSPSPTGEGLQADSEMCYSFHLNEHCSLLDKTHIPDPGQWKTPAYLSG